MRLLSVKLNDFKNYSGQVVRFDQRFTALLGPNGSGKTNVLEAIAYLCLTRSYASGSDLNSIRSGQDFFSVSGEFEKSGQRFEVKCVYVNGKKEIRVDGKECKKFSDHIGKFPMVMIAPQDIGLVWDGGEERRRFFDQLISQVNKNYLEDLIHYNHSLRQRNASLKFLRESASGDHDLPDFYAAEMDGPARRIMEERERFIAELLPLLNRYYSAISGTGEPVSVSYHPDLQGLTPMEHWKLNKETDLRAGRTTAGPQLDDYRFLLRDLEARRFGSQGQQKSFLIALKIAGFEILSRLSGVDPLLLLDDIFEKMDEDRTCNLLRMVAGENFGQVIMTDSSRDRALALSGKAGLNLGVVQVRNGLIES